MIYFWDRAISVLTIRTDHRTITTLSLFNFGSKGKLGIDIGTSSIKIVELEDSGRFTLSNYGLFELKSEEQALNVSSIDHSKPKSYVQLSDSEIVWGIKETLSRAKIRSKDTIASIQSLSTFATVVTLPYLSEEELAKTIPLEAKKYIPLPMSEVHLDWSIINASPTGASSAPTGESTKSTTPLVEVFLVAVPKSEAVRYQNIIRQSGLNLRALEIENTALIRSVIGNDLSPTAIINIGGRSTSILIVDKGVERLNRNYEVGGFEITKSIARAMNVNLKRAEELKRTLGLNPAESNTIRQVMSSLVDLIVFEAKKTIHNYEDSKNLKIGKIFLLGGLANMPGFYEYFKEKIDFEILRANPTARVIIPPEIERIRAEINSTFAVAIGLAMRKI